MGRFVGMLVGQMEAKALPAECRAAGRSRWDLVHRSRDIRDAL